MRADARGMRSQFFAEPPALVRVWVLPQVRIRALLVIEGCKGCSGQRVEHGETLPSPSEERVSTARVWGWLSLGGVVATSRVRDGDAEQLLVLVTPHWSGSQKPGCALQIRSSSKDEMTAEYKGREAPLMGFGVCVAAWRGTWRVQVRLDRPDDGRKRCCLVLAIGDEDGEGRRVCPQNGDG